MNLKYFLQKLLGRYLSQPIIPAGKTSGYSLVRSDRKSFSSGKHTKVYPPFYLDDVSLGDYSYIARNCNVTNCEIGRFCSIGPNFCCGLGIHPTNGISTAPMFYSVARQNGTTLCYNSKVEESKRTRIGNDVFIGANVTVLDGVTIGSGAIIGAGAVVTRDIPPYAIATGVPAKVRKYRFEEKTVQAMLKRKWWDEGLEGLQMVEKYFNDIDVFLDLGKEREEE